MSRPVGTKYIETPEALMELFNKYVDSLEIIKVPQSHVKLGVVYLEILEPMTMEGFKSFGYDNGVTIKNYIDNVDGAYSDYYTIVTRIKDRIYKNNFSRAAAGLYKEALIAKQLGLAAKIEQTNIEQPLFGKDAVDKK